MQLKRRVVVWAVMLAVLSGGTVRSWAYSVQTHEQLVDIAWEQCIQPLLLERYPHTSSKELELAHAYAYGGSAIQDLGYYPFGKQFFSDLTHYVRSGDFVASLIRQARNVNELAFAVGALSHYVGDNIGHSIAVNPSVAIEFPKLRRKYGEAVTYDQNPHAHVRTEFAFDVNEISKHRFAPSAYLRHVGLMVAHDLLERAFYQTYGLNLPGILGARRPTVRGYRFAVRSFLPRIAYAEVVIHRNGFPPDVQSDVLREFERNLSQADFQHGWNAYRRKAGIGTHLLALLIVIIPKAGKLSELAIEGPTAQTQLKYLQSVNRSTDVLRQYIQQIGVEKNSFGLPDRDLDTGDGVHPGAYRLTDETYAELLRKLTRQQGTPIPARLRDNILEYYQDPNAPISTKHNPKQWAEVQANLAVLKSGKAQPER
jgi:hypothetical protein